MPTAVKQLDGLQILRAAAVTIVAWGHAGLFYPSPSGTHLPDMGIFGVDIFFVLSGFILSAVVLRSDSRAGVPAAWQFFKRRLIRIFPIYWIFAAVNLVLLVHRHRLQDGYLYSVFLLPFPRYPSMPILVDFTWTLMFEMVFYLLLAAIQIVTVRRAVEVLICILVVLIALRLVVSIKQPVLIVAANPMLLEFVFGAVIALAYRSWGRHRVPAICLLVLGTGSAFLFVAAGVSSPAQQTILMDEHVPFRVFTWGLAATAIVAGTVFCEGAPRGGFGRLLVRLGNASYSAYLASALLIYACSRVFQVVFTPQQQAGSAVRALCQVASVLVVLSLGLAAYHLLEWPMLRSLQRRFR